MKENIEAAVKLANSLREKMPGVQLLLADLPPGVPRSADSCVIARALNFNCTVDAGGHGSWHATFFDVDSSKCKIIVSWAGLNDLDYDFRGVDKEHNKELYVVNVKLPAEVAAVAELFDQNELPDKYYTRLSDKDPYEEVKSGNG